MRYAWVVLGFLLGYSGVACAQTPQPKGADICTIDLAAGATPDNGTVDRVRSMLGHCKEGQLLEANGLPFNPDVPSTAYSWQQWMCAKNVPGQPGHPMSSTVRQGSVDVRCTVGTQP